MNYLTTNKKIVKWCGGTYGQIQSGRIFFPYEYIPDTIERTFCAVCFDVSMNYTNISTYDTMLIYFYIMCHVDVAIVPELPGLRYDMIAHQITRDFADKPFFGIGNAQVRMNRPYIVTRIEHVIRGRTLAFEVADFSVAHLNKRARKLNL